MLPLLQPVLVTVAVCTILILALWKTLLLTPFKLVIVFFHEASHVVACKLTCGHAQIGEGEGERKGDGEGSQIGEGEGKEKMGMGWKRGALKGKRKKNWRRGIGYDYWEDNALGLQEHENGLKKTMREKAWDQAAGILASLVGYGFVLAHRN
ncbi:hypothetical protein Ahy_A09g042238 [Arachis hypogaea]|uniref:Uncharacterized protein n=1 Tax=Arachis hypogaea TaxID=3818 RepID=A0A445BF81_ARAHY|nr:hypothetical protein Ahy_A09g042238 [Arachis hypogaea]